MTSNTAFSSLSAVIRWIYGWRVSSTRGQLQITAASDWYSSNFDIIWMNIYGWENIRTFWSFRKLVQQSGVAHLRSGNVIPHLRMLEVFVESESRLVKFNDEYSVLHVGMFLHDPLLLRQENTPRHLVAADVRLHLHRKQRRSLPRVLSNWNWLILFSLRWDAYDSYFHLFNLEKRSTSPLGASNPLARTRSAANRPTIPKSSKQVGWFGSFFCGLFVANDPRLRTEKERIDNHSLLLVKLQAHLESQNSLPKSLRAERKETPNKKRGFLKSLLKRNRSWMDDSLYSYLDEY